MLGTNIFGQDTSKFSVLTNVEKQFVVDFKKQSVDTFLLFKYDCFSYNIVDSSHKAIAIWTKNGHHYKQFYSDTSKITDPIKIQTDIFKYYFNASKIKHKKRKKKNIYARGWINPMSNFYSIDFYYDKNYISNIITEDEYKYRDKNVPEDELWKKWVDKLREEIKG